MTTRLEWWAYTLMVLSVFLICLFLNFVVKKINDARLNQRFLRLQEKGSYHWCSQHTQVLEPAPAESSEGDSVTKQTDIRISFVYNKEDNLSGARLKSDSNPTKESNLPSQSNIDAANSKLNFVGAIYTDLRPSKEVSETPEQMQICDNRNGGVFKEIMDRKAVRIYENKPIK